MATVEDQELREFIARQWLFLIDVLDLEADSDKAIATRHYMSKVAQRGFEMGRKHQQPERAGE